MLKALELLPVLFMLIGINILLSTYNSVARRHEVFSKPFLLDGIFKGLLFTGGLLALAYVLDIVEIGGFELTPAAILEGAMLFYAAKIAMTLKDLVMSFDKVVVFEGSCKENETPVYDSEAPDEQEYDSAYDTYSTPADDESLELERADDSGRLFIRNVEP